MKAPKTPMQVAIGLTTPQARLIRLLPERNAAVMIPANMQRTLISLAAREVLMRRTLISFAAREVLVLAFKGMHEADGMMAGALTPFGAQVKAARLHLDKIAPAS